MAEAITDDTTRCPLCGESLSLDVPDWGVPAKYRDILDKRDVWGRVSEVFCDSGSIDEAARNLLISRDVVARVLDFLCVELCGCRAVTCVTCLDDYRSEL